MILLALTAALAADAAADRVFFLVIDGMRDEEGVLAEDTNLPHIWGELKPQGSFAFPLENRDATLTDAAHRTIMSGRRQPLPGLPWYPGRQLQRTWTPTLAEAVGNATGLGGYVIGNTVFMDSQGRSLAPGYHGGAIREASTEANSTASDLDIYAQLQAELGADDRVVLYNIHAADRSGHADEWEGYLDGLKGADAIVADLVTRLGTPRDAFFVFSDHGRHRDDSWMGHGDDCSGCRQSWLLAFGAGIRPGVELESSPELVDLAPTAAWLLGAPIPSARGRVLSELLLSPPADPVDDDALVEPSLWLGPDGVVHEVARRLPRGTDDGMLRYRRRTVDGAWGAWTDFADVDAHPEAPTVVGWGTTLWRAWRGWQPELGAWGIFGQASTDGGASWGDTRRVARAVQFYETPAFAAGANGFAAAWWADARASGDAPATFHTYTGDAQRMVEAEFDPGDVVHVPTEPSPVVSATSGTLTLFAAIPSEVYDPPADGDTGDPGNQDRDLYLLRTDLAGATTLTRVTDTPTVEYWPSLAEEPDGTLVAAWAARSGSTLAEGAWSVELATSADHGASWSSPVTAAAAAEAWKPVVVTGKHGTWVLAVEVDGASQSIVAFARTSAGLERRAVVATGTGWVDDVHAVETDGGLLVAWSDGVDTLTHRLGDTLVSWEDLAAKPEDSGEKPAPVTPPCACSSGSSAPALGLLAALAAWRRRAKPRGCR